MLNNYDFNDFAFGMTALKGLFQTGKFAVKGPVEEDDNRRECICCLNLSLYIYDVAQLCTSKHIPQIKPVT